MPASNNSRRVRVPFLILFFFAIISISAAVGLYTDLLWFKEVGFQQVFWKVLSSRVILVGVFGLVFFILCLVNLLVVSRAAPAYPIPSADPEDPFERFREAFLPVSRWIPISVSGFLALLFSLRLAPLWDRFVLAMNAVPFGVVDPLFNKDIGFFMFRLPMYQLIYGWLFSALVVVTLLVTSAYYLTGAIRPQAQIDRVSPQVKVHLSVLIGLAALLRAWGYRINQYELVYSQRGTVVGASYTDVNAELPALKLLVAISIISAILFLVNIRFRGWTLPLIGVGLWLLTSVLAAGLFPFVIQRFQVEPAELQKEREFIDRNIEGTRKAFGLESMAVREFPVDEAGLSAASVRENQNTLDSVRLWDPQTLMSAFRQLQEIRTYYKFQDVDVDRYDLDPQRRQLMLALRELDVTSLQSRSWLNDHLVYTHGYGAVASPTNETTGEGAPRLLIREIPPVSDIPELKIDKPGIYFGEGPSTYSVVDTEQRELDYTAPEGNKTTVYNGKAGVKVEHLFRRLAFAWRFRDVNLAISGLIDGNSKVIFNRDVRERVRKAAPFLELDGDPYAVLSEGRIVWFLDAYTVSNMYPYSESLDLSTRTRIRGGAHEGDPSIIGMENYVRNSVKVTIDAYDGSMKLYVWDDEDPLIKAWRKAFPTLLTDGSEMPADLRAHIRYPEDLFRVQSFVYQRYHMTDPTDFYQREDEWVIPANPMRGTSAPANTTQELEPYYVLMRLPDTEKEEYVMILPMNPRNRPNMVSLLAAKSDPEEFGKLVDFRFPKGDQTFGVGQIHSRINANEEISRTITLLEQSGSNVILGNLLVIPVGKSILYSQPLFLQANNNAIPELKYVILADSDQIKMAPTLDQALDALLSNAPTVIPSPGTPGAPPAPPAPAPAPAPAPVPGPAPAPGSQTRDELLKEAFDRLNAAEQAARNGDWAAYGRELQAAKDALARAQAP